MLMDRVLMLGAGAEGSGIVLLQSAADEIEVEDWDAVFIVEPLLEHVGIERAESCYPDPDLFTAH